MIKQLAVQGIIDLNEDTNEIALPPQIRAAIEIESHRFKGRIASIKDRPNLSKFYFTLNDGNTRKFLKLILANLN